jgi:hypothetical protein
MLTITKIMLYILGGLALLLAVVLVWIASGNPGEQPTLQSTQVLQDTPNPTVYEHVDQPPPEILAYFE